MPNKIKGARLYKRKNGIFTIRDSGAHRGEFSTGTRDRRKAEAALARYIAERDQPIGPNTPDKVSIAGILNIYGEKHAPDCKDPARIGRAIEQLVKFFGELPVSTITGEVCRRYVKFRNRAPGTIRRELGTLQAAINYAHREGYLTATCKVWLPPKPAPRDRWLTREEVAKLLRAAWRNPKSRHLARYILIGVYTGTRKQAILNLRFMANTTGGWVDTERGMMYRRASGEAESKKRTPTAPLPRQLLAHLQRWKRNNASGYVIEANKMHIANIKTAWRTALAESGIAHCTPHDLRRTAVTWAMQSGAEKWAACGYFGLTMEILEAVYGHHHPDHLKSAVQAMETAGKRTLSAQGY